MATETVNIEEQTDEQPESKKKEEVVTAGYPEIDKRLGGGIPRGSLILIEGSSGAGKSVLTQQLTWGTLRGGSTVTVMTTENTVKSLLRQMESLNLDVSDYCLLGRLKVFPMQMMRRGDSSEHAFAVVSSAIRKQEKQDFVVLDAITSFIAHSSLGEVLQFFEECKRYCNQGMTIALVAHSYALDESTTIRIGSMCDARLRLTTENVGDRIMKTLEVAKIRGASQNTGNLVTFDVEPGLGIRIIPFSRAQA